MRLGILGFSIEEYRRLFDICEEKANEYYLCFIPDTLYKFFWLSKNKKENQIKLTTLAKNELWLSSHQKLNDPFEFKSKYVSLQENQSPIYELEIIRDIEAVQNCHYVCCFTTASASNLPMWAHF